MKRFCVACGDVMGKTGVDDPYICRACERSDVPRYDWLDV